MANKKPFTVNPVVNELKGSAWFRRPTESQPLSTTPTAPVPQVAVEQPPSHKQVLEHGTDNAQNKSVRVTETVERPQRSPVQQPKKKRRKRRAYDFDHRQLENMRRLRATRELQEDRSVSMSELMREAVDYFLKKQGVS